MASSPLRFSAEPPGGRLGLLAWLLPLTALAGGAGEVGLLRRSWNRGRGAPRPRRARTSRSRSSIPSVDEGSPRFDHVSWTSVPVAVFAGMVSFPPPVRSAARCRRTSRRSRPSMLIGSGSREPRARRRLAITGSVPLVVGFTAFFVLFGVGARLVGGRILGDQFLLEQLAGFSPGRVAGLAFVGAPWPERLVGAGLVREARGRGSRVCSGARSRCAPPCIVRAGRDPRAGRLLGHGFQGAALLALYSLGLAVPFVLAAALFTREMSAFRWLRDHYRVIQIVGGAIMVALGLLLLRAVLCCACT